MATGSEVSDWDNRVYLYTGSLPAQVIAYTPGELLPPADQQPGPGDLDKFDSYTTPYNNLYRLEWHYQYQDNQSRRY